MPTKETPIPGEDPTRYPNPYLAYAWVWIEDKSSKSGWTEITMEQGRPQRLLQFEYHRIADAGANQVVVSVYDETWITVQDLIGTADQSRMRFRFGYTEPGRSGRDPLVSPLYECSICDFTPTFRIDGVELKIEGITTAIVSEEGQKQKPVSATYKDANDVPLDIHEIVKIVADRNGWDSIIERTEPVLTTGNELEQARLGKKEFVQTNQSDMDFLMQLVPYAQTTVVKKDGEDKVVPGEGTFALYFDDIVVGDGGETRPVLHFHPWKKKDAPVKSYVFMRNKMSEIRSFSPQLNGTLLLKLGGPGEVKASYVDHQTGQVGIVTIHNQTTPNKVLLGGEITEAPPQNVVGEVAHVMATNKPLANEAMAVLRANNHWEKTYNACQSATLVVQGDPEIKPQTTIQVEVVLPNGTRHMSSGRWLILNVTDQIAGGDYTTHLDLVRNSMKASERIDKIGLGDRFELGLGFNPEEEAETGV